MGAVEAVQPLCQRLLFQATRLLLRSAAREPSVQAWILSEGDTLMVWKLDRLGHSVKQLVDLVDRKACSSRA